MVLGLIAQGLLAPGATAAPGPGRLPRSAQGGNADSSPGWLGLHAYLAHLLARPREGTLRDDCSLFGELSQREGVGARARGWGVPEIS